MNTKTAPTVSWKPFKKTGRPGSRQGNRAAGFRRVSSDRTGSRRENRFRLRPGDRAMLPVQRLKRCGKAPSADDPPEELRRSADREIDPRFRLFPGNGKHSLRREDPPRGFCEHAGNRTDGDGLTAGRGGTDAEHGGGQLPEGKRAPGVAFAAGIIFALHAGRAAVLHHPAPDVPVTVRVFVKPGLLQRPEEIPAHGHRAAGDPLFREGPQKILPPLFRRQRAGQDPEDLGVLGEAPLAGAVGEHAVPSSPAKFMSSAAF